MEAGSKTKIDQQPDLGPCLPLLFPSHPHHHPHSLSSLLSRCIKTIQTVFSFQVIKMLLIVVALFAFCWLPLQTYNLLSIIYSNINL